MTENSSNNAAQRWLWLGFLAMGLVVVALVALSIVGSINESNSAPEVASSDTNDTSSAQTSTTGGSATAPALDVPVSDTVQEQCDSATPTEPATRDYPQAEQVLEEGVDYSAILCTDAGAIYIDLYEDLTPVTVNNFVFLAQNDYYDNTIFHRVIQDFMAQAGDPTGTGRGGPGYQFQDEIVPSITFDSPGYLAMANAGANTNGSQFFVTYAATDWLNGAHTIFGAVQEGYANLTNVQLRDPSVADAPATTLQDVIIVTDPGTAQ